MKAVEYCVCWTWKAETGERFDLVNANSAPQAIEKLTNAAVAKHGEGPTRILDVYRTGNAPNPENI